MIPIPLELLFALLCLFLLVFWCKQFFDLMRKPNDAFAAPADKVIWTVILLVLNVFGALLYWLFFYREGNDAPSHEEIPLGSYERLIETTPEHAEEIRQSLDLPAPKRVDLEAHYFHASPQSLLSKYHRGPEHVGQGCYGVLLAVMAKRDIDPSNGTS